MAILPIALGTASIIVANTVAKQLENTYYQNTLNQQLLEQVDVASGYPAPPPILPEDAVPSVKTGGDEKLRPVIQLKPTSSLIRISKTGEFVDSTRDPIWRVELVVGGKTVDSVQALIGRSGKQSADRHVAGNRSPLPTGRYQIVRESIERGPFDDYELGSGYWIPVEPLFSTGRSSLGFHQDPSWGKQNGESGTSGCVGLKTAADTRKVADWIKQYNVHTVQVAS